MSLIKMDSLQQEKFPSRWNLPAFFVILHLLFFYYFLKMITRRETLTSSIISPVHRMQSILLLPATYIRRTQPS